LGPNLPRNVAVDKACESPTVCDVRLEKLKIAKTSHLLANFTAEYDSLLSDIIDVVVIATPISTHFELAEMALKKGKHV
jgi:predicted dehydrogenase